MNDRLRLLPREFLAAWVSAFGELPPEDFLCAYETVCEGLYFGYKTKEPWERGRGGGKRFQPSYHFADPSLLYVKDKADGRLAAITASLYRWQKRHPRGRA